MYGKNSSVNIDASAESLDELKTILQKVGITLAAGEPNHMMMNPKVVVVDKIPCITYGTSKEEEPKSNCNRRRWRTRWRPCYAIPKTNVHTDASMTQIKKF